MESEFIRLARKRGDVRNYNEVKYTDPNLLENDCPGFHIGEQVTRYNKYKVGDIVYVSDYVYKDGSKGGNHLFIIIDEENYAVPITYFGMLLSLKLEKVKYKKNILLKRDKQNGLDRDSIVKADTLYEIDNNNIEFCIGKVKEGLVEKFIKCYKGEKYE